jgi:2-dehydro-3-deoxyphosphogluconate aldolase / (4S)-4-hydroxy-2-oxoglutarate aldolase
MERRMKTTNLIIEQGILPQYFHPDPKVSEQILKALYKAGIRVVEYINRSETAIDNFLQLRKFADKELPGLQLGAGMIRNKIEATEFINEGANFITSPSVIEGVASLANINEILWIPGCLTATEISLADDLGARMIKLFPANLLGPAYLASMKEVFPDLLFLPTGGVETNESNLDSWFKNGAGAVGLGRKLISKNLVETKDYTLMETLTRQTLEMVKNIQGQ